MKLYIAWIEDLEEENLKVHYENLPVYYSQGVGKVNMYEGTGEDVYRQLFTEDWTATGSISCITQ